MKIRTRISLVFTIMTAAILFLLSCFVYVQSLKHSREYFFTRLKVRASITAESYFEDKENRVSSIRDRHLQRLPDEREYFFSNDDKLLQNIRRELPDIPERFIVELRSQGTAQVYNGFQHYSGIGYPVNDAHHFVIAAAYDESAEDHLRFLRNMLMLGFSASCLLMFLLGRVFANRIMQPVASIVSRVHEITTTNLSERLSVGVSNDEFSEMALTFNDMLERLETTFELQRNFIGNASHELNTPLTSILGEAEIILAAPRSTSEYVTSLEVIQYEAQKLRDVTSSLLKLSSISYEGKKQKIEPLQVDELLMSIKINLDQRMPDNNVRILVQNSEAKPDVYTLIGSSIWMELALTNIIQNSVKYSENKEVLVTLSTTHDKFFVEISDQGIGIPEDDMRYIFEPFFRGSNTTSFKGYGIGLPLASRIVKLHSGELKVFSKANVGTKVTLQFPRIDKN